jgi:hypothetical protein
MSTYVMMLPVGKPTAAEYSTVLYPSPGDPWHTVVVLTSTSGAPIGFPVHLVPLKLSSCAITTPPGVAVAVARVEELPVLDGWHTSTW